MKKTFRYLGAAIVAGSALSFGTMAVAQTTSVSTTTTTGTISEFGDDAIVVRSESAAEPVRYSYTEKTRYVDAAGNPVARNLVTSGVPVTVHYIKEGDRMIADRVVVQKTTTTTAPSTPAAVVEERESTTTTTTTED